MPPIVLGRSFFSKDDVKLASLIPNVTDMELDALESVLPLQESDFTVRKVDNNLAIFNAEKDQNFGAFLSKLLNLTSQRSTQAGLQLAARAGHIYTLRHPSAWFRRLCGTAEVREWLQEQIEDGNDIHFVIGFNTLFDASTAEGLALTSNHGGNFSVPLSELSGLPANSFTDVGGSAALKNNQASVHRYVAPGEQIFAIRLKRVVFRFLQPRDVDNARLEKTSRWIMSSDNRSAGDEFSEIVEAFLDGSPSSDEDEEEHENDVAELAGDDVEYHVLDG